jgi:hypothetical protein
MVFPQRLGDAEMVNVELRKSGNQESEESKKEDGVSRGKSTSISLTDKQVSVFSLKCPRFSYQVL